MCTAISKMAEGRQEDPFVEYFDSDLTTGTCAGNIWTKAVAQPFCSALSSGR